MQTSAIMFLQAVIHFITGDAFERGAKVSLSVFLIQFLTSVSLLSMKCFFKRHNDAHYTKRIEKKKTVEISDLCIKIKKKGRKVTII